MRFILASFVAIGLLVATLTSPGAQAQEGPPLAPETPTATFGSAVAEASVVYIEVYYRIFVRDPGLGVYMNDGFPYEPVVGCTGWGVGENRVITASHCTQTDVEAGTVPYDIIVGPAADFAFANNLYPGLSLAEIQNLAATTWTVEGDSANSAPEQEIFVSYCTVSSGLRGQSGTSTARVVDNVPIDEGDVALISIEDPGSLATAPIPVLEIADRTPTVGSEILSVGYPGAVGSATTGQVLAPSVQDGRISSIATSSFGGYQVLEVSSTIDSGMSGGPTVDFEGRALGVNSFGVIGDLDSFKFVSPTDRYVGELLARNGVSNELSTTDISYRQALTQYLEGNYSVAITLFDETLQRMPAHCGAQEYRIEAVRLRDEVGDPPAPTETVPAETEPAPTADAATVAPAEVAAAPIERSGDGDSSILPIALIAVGVAAIGGAVASCSSVAHAHPRRLRRRPPCRSRWRRRDNRPEANTMSMSARNSRSCRRCTRPAN